MLWGVWEVWSCCCQLPLSKDCMLEVWESSSNTSLQGRKGSSLGEKEIVALLCQAYDALTNSRSLWAQKLLIELSSCGKAKRREAVMDLAAQNCEVTVLPLLHKVKEAQKPKMTQKRKPRKAAKPSKADGSEMVDVQTASQQVEERIETQRDYWKNWTPIVVQPQTTSQQHQ